MRCPNQVQGALEALASVDTVVVRRTPAEDAFGGFKYTITFTSDYNGGDIPALVASSAGLNGTAVATVCTDGANTGLCAGLGASTVTGNQVRSRAHLGICTLTVLGAAAALSHTECLPPEPDLMRVRVCVFGQLSGTFIITAGGVPTAALPYNITSTALQVALSALPAVGNVAVSRSGPDTQLGYVWSITYLALTGNVAEPGDLEALGA